MIALTVASAAAGQTITYSDSSTEDRLKSEVGLAVDEDDLSLAAQMTMLGEDGLTRVLPSVTSTWSGLDAVNVETVLSYGDWNTAADPLQPTVDTSVTIDSGAAFIDRIEGNIRRSASVSDRKLRVSFTELDTGLRLFGGDALGVGAGVTLESGDEQSRALSSITSSLGIGAAVDVETVLRLQRGTGESFDPALDTTLVYDSPVPFIDQLEGELSRTASGASQQSLAVRFPEIAGGDEYGTSFQISSKAIVEEMLSSDGLQSTSMGVETQFSGFMPPLLGGSNSLSVKLQRELDGRQAQTSSVAYDHNWSPGDTASIGLNLEVLRRPDAVEPSMGITWNTQF